MHDWLCHLATLLYYHRPFLNPRCFCLAYHYFLSRVPTIHASEFCAICMVAMWLPFHNLGEMF